MKSQERLFVAFEDIDFMLHSRNIVELYESLYLNVHPS